MPDAHEYQGIPRGPQLRRDRYGLDVIEAIVDKVEDVGRE